MLRIHTNTWWPSYQTARRGVGVDVPKIPLLIYHTNCGGPFAAFHLTPAYTKHSHEIISSREEKSGSLVNYEQYASIGIV